MRPFEIIANVRTSAESLYDRLDKAVPNRYDIEYRIPEYNRNLANDTADEDINLWHTDADGFRVSGILVWSNMYPTEIKLPNGNIVSGRPFDLVLFDNTVVQHRVSSRYLESVRSGKLPNRYFIRLIPNAASFVWDIKRIYKEFVK